jgi:hypothetical protein
VIRPAVRLLKAGTPEATPEPAAFRVVVKDGRLNVETRDAPLAEFLAAVAAEAGLVIETDEAIQVRVTVAFAGLPLDEGVGDWPTDTR